MKNFLACAAASTLIAASPAFGDVINYNTYNTYNTYSDDNYGALEQISGYSPSTWNVDPVVAVGAAILGATVLFLHVPDNHRKNWKTYCSRYNACNSPVRFVRSDWYNNVYKPGYKKAYGKDPTPGKGSHGANRNRGNAGKAPQQGQGKGAQGQGKPGQGAGNGRGGQPPQGRPPQGQGGGKAGQPPQRPGNAGQGRPQQDAKK